MKSEILAVYKFAVEKMNNLFKVAKASSSEQISRDAVISSTLTQAMRNSLRETGSNRDPSSEDFDEPGSTI